MRLPAMRLPAFFDGLFIAAVYVFFVTVYLFQIDFNVYMRHNDGWWYLNRAWQHSHGVLDEVSFYTLAYPLLVGAVNWLLRDLPLSAIVVNAVVQLFLLVGIYILGRQLAGRAAGLLAVTLFALNSNSAIFARLISADFLLMAISVWAVILGLELAKQPRKPMTVALGMLMAVLPFVRTEGVVYGGLVVAGTLAVWIRRRRWHDIVQHGLILASIVGLAWLGYVVWLVAGADMLEGVGDVLIHAYGVNANTFSFRLQKTSELLGIVIPPVYWIALLACAGLTVRAKHRKAPLEVLILVPALVAMIAFITITSPYSELRYFFQVAPYLSILLSGFLVRLPQRFPLSLILILVLIVAALGALEALIRVQPPLLYRNQPEFIEVKVAVEELDRWRHANGYEATTFYTLCTDLMIFAQFDIRLPYTGLLFSSRRFAPPERVLPQIAEQGGLLITCPSFIDDLYNHPFSRAWTRLYRYWGGAERDNPELADMARYPLEEVGRVREYVIYRVKPSAAGLSGYGPSMGSIQ